MDRTWAVIGGGNGGQALAGHLAILGQKVRLFDVMKETVDKLNEKGGIGLSRAVEGFGPLEFATTDMEKAMRGADNIILVLPSIYHASIAKKMIPYLRDGQTVLLHPESSCGAIAFRRQLDLARSSAGIVLGATSTLLYSCRILEPGKVCVFGLKQDVPMAALPAKDNDKLADAVCGVLPWFRPVENVAATSVGNLNAMMHPAPMLLNTARIEAEPPQDYEYYHEGITPSIGKYIEYMDEERIAVGKALGVKLRSVREDYVAMYRCGDADTPLYMLCRNNQSYEGIMTAKTLRTRYLLEDIPYSLVPIQAVARIAGVETPCIDAIVGLAKNLLRGELDEGRTAQALGIDHMTKEDFIKFIEG
jgi:opine dehydrogenase